VAALSSDSTLASNGIMLYLVGYSVTNLVVFAGLIAFFNMTGREMISDFAGLADQQPFLAASIAIGMFSLGGLPIFAGFAIKFYLFTAVAEGGFLWLASLAIFSSLIALYYYLQVIRQMYIQPALAAPGGSGEAEPGQGHGNPPIPPLQRGVRGDSPGTPAAPVGSGEADASPPPADGTGLAKAPSVLMLAVLVVGLAAVFWIGVYPSPLLEAIEAASQAILPGV
jgi:formate hydrogenlyase subunit 3/multisubunit Na+/H+ antiporter MnhD subunit